MNIDVSIQQLQEQLDSIADGVFNANAIRAREIKGVIGNLGILREHLSRNSDQRDVQKPADIDYIPVLEAELKKWTSNQPPVICGEKIIQLAPRLNAAIIKAQHYT